MKIFKKIIVGIVVVVFVVAIVAFFLVRHISRKALPDYNEPIQLSGLIDKVNVYRDTHAVPHVYATNEHDLYMTVGYLMAQDRLWQMDLLRRVTMGRLSEIFGKDMVDSDHLLRALRIPEKSKLVLMQTDENIQLALDAFSRGVNQFIENNQNSLPPEFTILGYKPEPWEPFHSVNLIGYMAWDLSGSWGTEIILHKLSKILDKEKFEQLLPQNLQQKTFVYPIWPAENNEAAFALLQNTKPLEDLGIEIFNGSNNWVVSAKKSETGFPLFANDMHLGFGSPGIWYQIHQVIDGKLNVTGLALPGQPMIIVGHNDKIAWGMTNLYVDDMDFYTETLSEENANKYLFMNEWKPLKVNMEKIAVKGADTIIKEIKYTHRGPIISGYKKIANEAISMRWTGNEYSNELRSVYKLNRATNWDEFRDALTTFTSVSQNVAYADVYGNIGMQTSGGLPMRKDGNGMFVSSGLTDQYDWVGMVPFNELPYSLNPPEGFVSSANNRTIDTNYHHVIGHWFDLPSRIDRINEMLNEKEKLNVDDFKRMLGDFKSKHVELHLPIIVETIEKSTDLSENEKTALNALRKWDMVMAADGFESSVFEKFYLIFVKNILHDELGDDVYKELIGARSIVRSLMLHMWKNKASAWVDNINTTEKESFNEVLMASFKQTIAYFEATIGNNPEEWKWGKMHQLTLKHPLGKVKILDQVFKLNKGPFPVNGSYHTVNPFSYSFRDPFVTVHGASQRHIYNTNNWNDSYVVIPTGTSGIPASDYYLDQTEMFLNNKYKKDLWLKDDIIKEAKFHAVFSPN